MPPLTQRAVDAQRQLAHDWGLKAVAHGDVGGGKVRENRLTIVGDVEPGSEVAPSPAGPE